MQKLYYYLATALVVALSFAACTPAVIPLPDFTATPVATTVPTVAPATAAPTATSLPTKTPVPNPAAFTLTSPVFENNAGIPAKFTCDGANVSPALAWNEPPAGTISFALIVDDPDAVSVAGYVWDHWILFNIAPETRSLDEGTRPPEGSLRGVSSGGVVGYEGPCPPSQHHYNFTLYALDTSLELKAGTTKKAVLGAIDGHILAQSQLTGLYPAK